MEWLMGESHNSEESEEAPQRAPRKSLVLRVVFESAQDYLSGWTENISEGGFFLRGDFDHSVGDELTLSLSFPGLLDELSVECRVAWLRRSNGSKEPGMGVALSSDLGRRKMAKLALLTNDQVHQEITRDGIYRILVVETNTFIQDSCQRVLNYLSEFASEAIEVSFVSNDEEAYRDIRHSKPNLILCDTSLESTRGERMMSYLRGLDLAQNIPMIAMTSGGQREQRLLKDLNIEAFLQKPIQFGELLETIVYLIHLRDHGVANGGR